MIDETGKKVWEETFDLWGKPHDRLETRVVGGAILTNVKKREETTHPEISLPFRFPGQYHDEETGLYYNRYRYYMPNEGMYTQRDPIGLAGGNPTVYGYVKNTLSELDPFGLNLNSNDAVSEFGIYEIYVNGNLHKIGKADLIRVTKSTNLPTRLHGQLRKLKKIHGTINVTGSVVEDLGTTTTQKAKLIETSRIQSHYDKTGIVPEGNKKSFEPQSNNPKNTNIRGCR